MIIGLEYLYMRAIHKLYQVDAYSYSRYNIAYYTYSGNVYRYIFINYKIFIEHQKY